MGKEKTISELLNKHSPVADAKNAVAFGFRSGLLSLKPVVQPKPVGEKINRVKIKESLPVNSSPEPVKPIVSPELPKVVKTTRCRHCGSLKTKPGACRNCGKKSNESRLSKRKDTIESRVQWTRVSKEEWANFVSHFECYAAGSENAMTHKLRVSEEVIARADYNEPEPKYFINEFFRKARQEPDSQI